MIKAGTVCKVICDSNGFFQPGDIVVALEDASVPYCCLLENYVPNKSIDDYTPNLFNALIDSELEVLDDDRTEE